MSEVTESFVHDLYKRVFEYYGTKYIQNGVWRFPDPAIMRAILLKTPICPDTPGLAAAVRQAFITNSTTSNYVSVIPNSSIVSLVA